MNVGRLKWVPSAPGTLGVPSVCSSCLPSREYVDRVGVVVDHPDALLRIIRTDVDGVRAKAKFDRSQCGTSLRRYPQLLDDRQPLLGSDLHEPTRRSGSMKPVLTT